MNRWQKILLILIPLLSVTAFILWESRAYIAYSFAIFITEKDYRLINAAKKNDIPEATRLIKRGFDINKIARWITSTTALHTAISYGHIEMVKLLVANGARTDIKTSHGLPLDLAKNIARGDYKLITSEIPSWEQVMQNQKEIILLLQEAGAPSEEE